MSFKNEDRPVFPLNGERWQKEIGHGVASYDYHGITKREYFAAMAMQGICAKQAEDKYHVNDGWLHPETVAKNAVQIADELLKALDNV